MPQSQQRDIAASALTSGVTGQGPVIGGGTTNPVKGILNSAVRYGSNKLFGNQASWNFGEVAIDAFGNALGNSIVSGLSSAPKSTNTATISPTRSGNTQSVGTMGGAPASQGAVDINPENALERWNRLEASGELDNLSDNDYYNLATDANSIENATSPITSFLGSPTQRKNLVNIFEPALIEKVSSVMAQKEYHAKWLKSLEM
ncbi:hypothetical protein L1D59_07505 [Pseudoalteromonas piscicida]|uniref:hypothetical protein n=1 Tax=Pseudoalteromonas piscicida TaxID=43662 RepID=UPI001EFCBAA5|nr:hypothetical protein [Pseudoalteromonas piscicida]MCG9768453.1 hypothetical protein [Pseudoalteromonas piscicida]